MKFVLQILQFHYYDYTCVYTAHTRMSMYNVHVAYLAVVIKLAKSILWLFRVNSLLANSKHYYRDSRVTLLVFSGFLSVSMVTHPFPRLAAVQ